MNDDATIEAAEKAGINILASTVARSADGAVIRNFRRAVDLVDLTRRLDGPRFLEAAVVASATDSYPETWVREDAANAGASIRERARRDAEGGLSVLCSALGSMDAAIIFSLDYLR